MMKVLLFVFVCLVGLVVCDTLDLIQGDHARQFILDQVSWVMELSIAAKTAVIGIAWLVILGVFYYFSVFRGGRRLV